MRRLRWILLLVVFLQAPSLVLTPRPAHASAQLRVTLDAGHGGDQVGSSYRFADGTVLQEKALNLQLALLLRQLLQQNGYRVTLTRTTDTVVNVAQQDLNGDGRVGLADELQARVDAANTANSDFFVSICLNGSSDPSANGTETFWNPKRPFAAANQRLAENIQKGIVTQLTATGYATRDRGAQTDASLLGGDSLYLLGPASNIVARPSRMPAVVAEPLFLTNPHDASVLRDPRTLSAIAQGLFDGIKASSGLPTQSDAPPSLPVSPTPSPVPAQQKAWTVWAETYADSSRGRDLAQGAMRSLTTQGLPGNLITTSQVPSLIPGFVVLTSGTFATRQAALAHAARVRQAGFRSPYVRPVAQ